jgi:hypothetical protein
MKKLIINFLLIIFILLTTLLTILSTIGIETNKFNKFISDKVSKTKNVNLDLDLIKFKLDPKALSLFLETDKPKINYRNLQIPVRNIKVYIDFLSLLKSDPKIKKSNLILEELNISQIKELSKIVKPSNFNSLLNNKIKKGKFFSEVEIFLDEKGTLENFIAKGSVRKLEVELIDNFYLSNTNLNFFADKNDILIKKIFGEIEGVAISDGDIKLNLENGIKLNSNFTSNINLDEQFFNKNKKLLNKLNLQSKVINLDGNFNNNFSMDFDNTYKVKNYKINIIGKIKNSKIRLLKPLANDFLTNAIKEINFSDLQIETEFTPKNINSNFKGKYSFDNKDFLNMHIENNVKNGVLDLKLNFDYKDRVAINLINYKKSKDTISSISLDLKKKNNKTQINEINFKEGKNIINIKGLILINNIFSSFKEILVKTKNNNFLIINDKKILVSGTKFDATNLIKYFNSQENEHKFENINSEIEVDFENIKVPMSENLQNFKLLGQIKKGKFVKISSKGDFGGENFLDISMKKSKQSNKKYLEIYSDLTRPLLTEYSFFDGLSGGKLLFTSIIDDSKSISKLKIEDFKTVNTPGLIRLLSLADLGGLADLAKGDGLSFDLLEINMEKEKNFLKLNEILALGPSVSVLMEGYHDEKGLTSLRGTLVPAKTLNKMISKIPLIGKIVIPKEVGEGLFGISFKIKGPKGKTKTTINPIRTLTPRFIQKIIEKNKTVK